MNFTDVKCDRCGHVTPVPEGQPTDGYCPACYRRTMEEIDAWVFEDLGLKRLEKPGGLE